MPNATESAARLFIFLATPDLPPTPTQTRGLVHLEKENTIVTQHSEVSKHSNKIYIATLDL